MWLKKVRTVGLFLGLSLRKEENRRRVGDSKSALSRSTQRVILWR
jgi:hypothetical protein